MPASPYAIGLQALVRRSRSAREICGMLSERGFSDEAIDEAIQRLTQDGYLDDQRFARNLTRIYRERSKSALYIRYKLRERGLADDLICEALNDREAGRDDLDSIRSILSRKYPTLLSETAPRELRNKAYKYLTTNGFRIDDVTKILSGMDNDERQ